MESGEDLAASITEQNEMALPALVKINRQHPLIQQDQDLGSWGVCIYTEINSSLTSCILNS